MGFRMRALVGALAVVVAAGCSHGSTQKGPPPLAVDTSTAKQQDIATFVSLDGQISPLQQSTLSSPISGTVTQIYVTEGQRVQQGQLLAKIDDSTLRAQLAQNQASAAQYEAMLSSANLQHPIVMQSTSAGIITAEQALSQARNNVIKDEANLSNAKLVYDQNSTLYKQGYQSKQQLENSRALYVAAQQQVAVDQDIVKQSQAAVSVAQSNVGQNDIATNNIAQTQAQLKQAQAQIQYYQAQIVQTNVTAPYDGFVTQRLLDPGAYQAGNVGILQVSQIDKVYVNANVPDENLQYVRRGTPASFTTSSVPGRVYRGTIFDVNAVPTQNTLSYRARMIQPNPDDSLRGGMLVAVSVRKQYAPGATVVPLTSVFQTDAGASIFTVVDGKAKQIPVTLGVQTDTLAQVKSPDVKPGTVVITTRPDALQDGSVVAVVNGPGKAPAGGPAGPH